MLEDAAGIRRVILCCGYCDLRKGILGLAQIVGTTYKLNPYEQGTLFLFSESVQTDAKGFCGWATVSFSYTAVSRAAVWSGRVPNRKRRN